MKKIIAFFVAASMLIAGAVTASAEVLSPGLDIIAEDYSMTVSAFAGEEVTFKAEQFLEAVGRDELSGIRITSLPEEQDGSLCFGDVEATEGQVIKADVLSKLRFEPGDNTEAASFCFTVDDSYTMTCNVLFSDKKNNAPATIDSGEIRTFTNTVAAGEMRGVDKDGDALYFEVVEYPEGGKLTFDSSTGEFTYTAGSRVMKDSFTYRVKDSLGEYSETASYTLYVIENEAKTVFADMDESTSLTAATVMTDEGYMSCSDEDGKLRFEPDAQVSRLDFLVTAMNVFGAAKVPEIENTGFADDGDIPAKHKGYVYSAAKLGIVSDAPAVESVSFRPDDPITKAEASVILNNIIGYKAKTECTLSDVPQWAGEAVSAMYELGVYDLEDGKAACSSTLTRESAAEMLYRVSCLLYE